MVIVTGVCVGSWDKFHANVVPHAPGPVMALSGQTSIGAAYNTILTAYRYSRFVDVLILQHDDLEITDPLLVEKLLEVVSLRDVGIVGVAGARGVTGSIAWWNFDTVGHQMTDGRLIDFGQRSGFVDALEGSFLAFTPRGVAHLAGQFDEVPGFHGYDVGICAKATKAGLRCVVADIDTHHHTTVGVFKSAEQQRDWYLADQRFREGPDA